MSEYNNKNTLLKWKIPFYISSRWMKSWMNAWGEDDLWLKTSWRLWKISWSRLNNRLENSSLWMILLFFFTISRVYCESLISLVQILDPLFLFSRVSRWSPLVFWILSIVWFCVSRSSFYICLICNFFSPFETFYSNKKQEKTY